MMSTQPTPRQIQNLGLDPAQVRNTARALAPADLGTVVQAACAPFLGESVHTDQAGQITGPRTPVPALAASGCVFSLVVNEGTYPREHHWLTHLGWMVALYLQPGGSLDMPQDAVDLYKRVNEHSRRLTGALSPNSTAMVGTMLWRTMRQLELFQPGQDAEYRLLARVTQSVLCQMINDRAPGAPLSEGGYDDVAKAMVRQAVIDDEDDDAAFDLADQAHMPEAYQARYRAMGQRAGM